MSSEAPEPHARTLDRALAREIFGFYFRLSLRFAVQHEVEFATWLLLDKVACLYFLSQLPNILEAELLYLSNGNRNYLTRCYEG